MRARRGEQPEHPSEEAWPSAQGPPHTGPRAPALRAQILRAQVSPGFEMQTRGERWEAVGTGLPSRILLGSDGTVPASDSAQVASGRGQDRVDCVPTLEGHAQARPRPRLTYQGLQTPEARSSSRLAQTTGWVWEGAETHSPLRLMLPLPVPTRPPAIPSPPAAPAPHRSSQGLSEWRGDP